MYCSHFDLSRPYCLTSDSRNCLVQCPQRRPVTALPGSARKRMKLSVIATNTVTSANTVRLTT